MTGTEDYREFIEEDGDYKRKPEDVADQMAEAILDEGFEQRPDTDDRTRPATPDEEAELGAPPPWVASDLELFGSRNGKERVRGFFELSPDTIVIDIAEIRRQDEYGSFLYTVTGLTGFPVAGAGKNVPAKAGQRLLLDIERVLGSYSLQRWGRKLAFLHNEPGTIWGTVNEQPHAPDSGDELDRDPARGNRTPHTPSELEPTSGLSPAQRQAEAQRKNAEAILARTLRKKDADPLEVDDLITRTGGFPLTPESAPGLTLPPQQGDDR